MKAVTGHHELSHASCDSLSRRNTGESYLSRDIPMWGGFYIESAVFRGFSARVFPTPHLSRDTLKNPAFARLRLSQNAPDSPDGFVTTPISGVSP